MIYDKHMLFLHVKKSWLLKEITIPRDIHVQVFLWAHTQLGREDENCHHSRQQKGKE